MEYYAIPGSSSPPNLCKYRLAPKGSVLMTSPYPGVGAIANTDGTWDSTKCIDISLVEADTIKEIFPNIYLQLLMNIGFEDFI